jgi:hypothetical protein
MTSWDKTRHYRQDAKEAKAQSENSREETKTETQLRDWGGWEKSEGCQKSTSKIFKSPGKRFVEKRMNPDPTKKIFCGYTRSYAQSPDGSFMAPEMRLRLKVIG